MINEKNAKLIKAPELQTTEFLNSLNPITLESLRGRVVLLEVFQMLCPACVSHALPQATRVTETFSAEDVCVIGLHSVFEHHEAQGSRAALQAFLYEYRIKFPVAIDMPNEPNRLPKTMTNYAMHGTPTLILIDCHGFIRAHRFGTQPDMVLGSLIMALLAERHETEVQHDEPLSNSEKNAAAGCFISLNENGGN